MGAIALLGITGATNSLGNKYTFNTNVLSKAEEKCQKNSGLKHINWGIYTKTKSAAKALASTFKWSGAPEVHGSGKYGHYHDKTHSFHVWFGKPQIYYQQG